MQDWQNIGRVLLITGLLIAAAGLLAMFWDRLPWLRHWGLFRLPGDIVMEKKNFRLFFPVTTCIIVSIVLSLVLWFFGRK
jgi:hypothetical protein